MAKTKSISHSPRAADAVETADPSPIVWSASIAMREDGTLEVNVKGETGHHMAKAAMDALRSLDRIRQEPALSFTRGRGSSG